MAIKMLKINGDSIDKMRLLDIASHLVGVDEEVISIANEVLEENIVPARPSAENAKTEEELNLALSTTFEMAVPIMAHGVALSKIDDPNLALAITIDALNNQPEKFITDQILNNTIKKFPDLEESLLQVKNEDRKPSSEDESEKEESIEEEKSSEFIIDENTNDI